MAYPLILTREVKFDLMVLAGSSIKSEKVMCPVPGICTEMITDAQTKCPDENTIIKVKVKFKK